MMLATVNEGVVGWHSRMVGCDFRGHMSHSHVNTIMNEVLPQGPSLSFLPHPLLVSATVTSLSYSLPLCCSTFTKRSWK